MNCFSIEALILSETYINPCTPYHTMELQRNRGSTQVDQISENQEYPHEKEIIEEGAPEVIQHLVTTRNTMAPTNLSGVGCSQSSGEFNGIRADIRLPTLTLEGY